MYSEGEGNYVGGLQRGLRRGWEGVGLKGAERGVGSKGAERGVGGGGIKRGWEGDWALKRAERGAPRSIVHVRKS